jgi:hypothetical protein
MTDAAFSLNVMCGSDCLWAGIEPKPGKEVLKLWQSGRQFLPNVTRLEMLYFLPGLWAKDSIASAAESK